MSPEAHRHIATPPAVWAAHLQVAVDALGSTLVHSQITLGETVEEVAIFISCAVLLKDFPHFRLKKGHVYVNSYHLKSKQHGQPSIRAWALQESRPTYGFFSCPDASGSQGSPQGCDHRIHLSGGNAQVMTLLPQSVYKCSL